MIITTIIRLPASMLACDIRRYDDNNAIDSHMAYVYTCIYIYIYMYTHIHVYTYMCNVYIYIYIYIYPAPISKHIFSNDNNNET